MRVLVTGASGLVGGHLLPALLAAGHTPIAASRDPARHEWPEGTETLAWDARGPLPAVRADAAVHLAGERVVGTRWTEARRRALTESRILPARRLAESGIPVLVSASAAGYYGARPEGPCAESRPAGTDFLAQLCVAWEAAAQSSPGRVAVLRIGHVLAREGGYLGTLLPFARLGLAGPIAGGRQPLPWVHVADVAAALVWAVEGEARGAYNVAAPAHDRQRDLSRLVGRAVRRPVQAPIPGLALKLRFGAGAGPALLGGQELAPERLLAEGFRFRFTDLGAAVQDLLG